MNLRRAFAITASLAALALSCKTPTQITVVLKGRGIACEEAAGGEAPLLGGDPVFDESGVVASTAIGFGGGGPEVGAKKTDRCLVAVDGRADLGEVVLLPGSSGGAVEVLAIAVVDGTSDSAAAPSSVEDCLVEYQRLLDPAEKCTVDDACVGCIFASRSLEFVDATRLTLEIELSTACAGVFCEPGSTCVEGECVSSSCPAGANECAVGVGGSGAGAAGGGGDQGGAGQGGAAAGDVWSRFDTFDVDGVDPWDVVGAGQGEEHTLWIAADQRLCVVPIAGPPECTGLKGAGAYRAVAARNASYVTAGALGVGRNNGAIAPPENDYTPSPDATFDVAAGLGTGIEWLYFGSMGAALVGNSSVEPQDVAGAALLTLGQLGAVFQVAGSSLYTKNTLDLTPLPLGAESSGWLIWGVEVTETWPLFMVPSEGDGEVYRAGFSAIGKRLDEQVVVLTPSGNDFTGPVHALFGEQSESGGARLWAVGGADAPWLRSAEVSLDSNATTVEWVERPLPADLSGPLRSVWASQTFVAIAGPGGVYEARVVDLLK